MKYVVTIVENYLFAVHKEKSGKDIYYLQCIKHYDSGKTYNECIFLSKNDYDVYKAKYGEKQEK